MPWQVSPWTLCGGCGESVACGEGYSREGRWPLSHRRVAIEVEVGAAPSAAAAEAKPVWTQLAADRWA